MLENVEQGFSTVALGWEAIGIFIAIAIVDAPVGTSEVKAYAEAFRGYFDSNSVTSDLPVDVWQW